MPQPYLSQRTFEHATRQSFPGGMSRRNESARLARSAGTARKWTMQHMDDKSIEEQSRRNGAVELRSRGRRPCAGGGGGWPTSARRRRCTATWPRAGPGEEREILLRVGRRRGAARRPLGRAARRRRRAGPPGRAADAAAGVPGPAVRVGVRPGAGATRGDPVARTASTSTRPRHGGRRADPRGGGARSGRPRPGPGVRHVPRRRVRRQRRPGQQPRPWCSASPAAARPRPPCC